jgi:hypothetical protein
MSPTHCPHRHPVRHLVGSLYACTNVRGRIGVWRFTGGYWQSETTDTVRELAVALMCSGGEQGAGTGE